MNLSPNLPEKVLAVDVALSEVPHAFGGALALAYYAEPRATLDIDVTVFVPEDEAERVREPLRGLGVACGDAPTAAPRGQGQVRVWWGSTPVDLFFSYDPFHDAAARAIRMVPFADATIPILAAEHLVVCKVVFDRARDWVDIVAMLDSDAAIDAAEVGRWVGRIVGDDDPRYQRILTLLASTP